MDSNDRGILTLLAKGMRDLRAQVSNLARQPGPSGKDGRDGKDGLDGKDGIGLRGVAGADGADGARGQDDPQGVPGADGERGPVGPMPKHEWKGTQLRFQQTDSKWGKWTDLQGKPGKAGSGGGVFVGGGSSGGTPGGVTHPISWGDIADKPTLVLEDDDRLTDSRSPTGGAGGVLSGTFPNPGFAVDMAEQGELDTQVQLVYAAMDDLDAAKIEEAPSDGKVYGRKNGGHVVIPNITVSATPPDDPAVGDIWISF